MSADGLHQMRHDRRGRAAGLVAPHAAGPAAGGGKAFIAGPEPSGSAGHFSRANPPRGAAGIAQTLDGKRSDAGAMPHFAQSGWGRREQPTA